MSLVLLAALALGSPSSYAATVSTGAASGKVLYQGRLEKDNFPVTGDMQMIFRLYQTSTGGSSIWNSGNLTVPVTQGVFGAELDIPFSILGLSGFKYLEAEVQTQVLSPREALQAVPYAMVAKTVEPDLQISTLTVDYSVFMATAGGSVGIGTLSPASGALLQVLGDVVIGTATIHDATSAADLYVTGNLVIDGKVIQHQGNPQSVFDAIGIGAVATGSELFNVDAASVVVLTSGNVGIGTTNPGVALDILRADDPQLHIRSSASSDLAVLQFNTGGNLWDLIANPDQNTNNRFSIRQTGVEFLTIKSGGNVGIGTTDPQAELHVGGGQLHLDNAEPLAFRNAAGTGVAADILSSSSNDLRLRTAGSERITIESGGDVGIGTADPQVRLHVAGGALHLNNNQLLGFRNAAGSGVAADIFANTSNELRIRTGANQGITIETGGQIGINVASAGSQVEIWGAGATSATSALNVANSAGTSALFVRDDRNVGIDTTSPGSRLTVRGSTSDNTASAANVTNSGSTSMLFIRNDGFVGIGTTAPSPSSPAPRVGVRGAGATNATAAANFENSGGTSILFIRNDGFVGVGTTNPGSGARFAVTSLPTAAIGTGGIAAGRGVVCADAGGHFFVDDDGTIDCN